MEVIRISGYTEAEKLEIAKRYLVKKQTANNGLNLKNVVFTDDSILGIIQSYTREAGVRNLEREIASICRKVAKKVVKEGVQVSETVTGEGLKEYLGVLKFRKAKSEERNEIGFATGLAWTEVGGEVLSTEASLMDGKGKLTLTGKLGDVMQESAQAAMSYVRSRANSLGISHDFYRRFDLHIHVPEGAIPKDGPSAGITMATALVSALTKNPVRSDVAMTGEITLRGKVLPIGGVKEKLLAAHRAGIKTVVLPLENEKDLAEIPKNIQDQFSLHFVETMDEVLKVTLENPVQVLEQTEELNKFSSPIEKDYSQESVTH
jgi:ATP-dependent Lon protease